MTFTQLCVYFGLFNKFLKNEIGGACSTYGEKTGAYRILVERPEGKTPLGRPRCIWEDNIKMDQEVGWGILTELIRLRIGKGGGLL
jgi:hypothetical protein